MDEIAMIVGAAISSLTGASAKVIFAPSEALAEHWKESIKRRLVAVTEKAARKNEELEASFDQRTAMKVLQESAFTDDAVVSEYLAGVLAGSRADDDSGLPWVMEIGQMSKRELLLHYILYRALWGMGGWAGLNYDGTFLIRKGDILEVISVAPDSSMPELDTSLRLLNRRGFGDGEDLGAGTTYYEGAYGPDDPIWARQRGDSIDRFRFLCDVIRFNPTRLGAELFMWGCGNRSGDPRLISQMEEKQVRFEPEIPPVAGYREPPDGWKEHAGRYRPNYGPGG